LSEKNEEVTIKIYYYTHKRRDSDSRDVVRTVKSFREARDMLENLYKARMKAKAYVLFDDGKGRLIGSVKFVGSKIDWFCEGFKWEKGQID